MVVSPIRGTEPCKLMRVGLLLSYFKNTLSLSLLYLVEQRSGRRVDKTKQREQSVLPAYGVSG